jgi:hypothetical protein
MSWGVGDEPNFPRLTPRDDPDFVNEASNGSRCFRRSKKEASDDIYLSREAAVSRSRLWCAAIGWRVDEPIKSKWRDHRSLRVA